MGKILLAVVVFAAAVATGSLAAGQFGESDQFFACAKDETGQLRLVEEGTVCLPSEAAVSWNAGSAGGGTAFTTVTQTAPAVSGLTSGTATCPVGGRVVGGGAHADPVQWGNVIATYPASDSTWTATAALNTPNAQSLTIYAICATP